MTDRKVKKLRNKIWFSLWGSFFVIVAFAMVNAYLSNVSFSHQRFQSTVQSLAHAELQLILAGTSSTGTGFVIEIKNQEVLSIQGDTDFSLAEAEELISQSFSQYYGHRIRNRFLWRFPQPFLEYQGTYWSYVRLNHDFDTFGSYLLFWDASEVRVEIANFNLLFVIMGSLLFILIGFISHIVANFLVKPTATSFERQKQFVADVSHELKTPLTMVKNNLTALQMSKDETTDNQKRWLNNIDFGYNRMQHLITDLLQLAKLEESHASEQALTRFDFSQIATLISEQMKPQADDKQLELSLFIDSDIYVTANVEKIMQVMTILLDNAIKYTNQNGMVIVRVKKNRQLASFIVENSGAGIPVEKLPKVFERFYQVDESRNSEQKSHGLGLSIAKTIVEQAGGKIKVLSVPNELTTAYFTIKTS